MSNTNSYNNQAITFAVNATAEQLADLIATLTVIQTARFGAAPKATKTVAPSNPNGKRRGRPAGSKNKPKGEATDQPTVQAPETVAATSEASDAQFAGTTNA